jgi:hypothetical protein
LNHAPWHLGKWICCLGKLKVANFSKYALTASTSLRDAQVKSSFSRGARRWAGVVWRTVDGEGGEGDVGVSKERSTESVR